MDSLVKKTYLLPTVRVIADKPEDAIGALHIIDYIEQKGIAALNLYEGLQDIAGVTNTTGTKDESNLRIRGFRSNEVKVLVDGRPLNSGYFGNIDLHQFSPSDIKEIHIIKGPSAAIYGTNTMGGVVNIITSDPGKDSWLKLNLLAKRNNANRFEISSDHKLKKFGYRVSLAREHNEGIVLPKDFTPTPFENGGVRNHSLKTQYDFQTRFDYEFNPFRQVGASAGFTYVPEKLIPSSIYTLDYRQYTDWMHYWTTLEYVDILNEFLKLSSHLYYDGGQDIYREYSDASHQHLILDSHMRYYTLGFNPRMEWVPDAWNTFNFGFRLESMHSTRKDNGNYLQWTPHWLNIYNAFCQWKYQLNNKVNFLAGLGASSHHCDVKSSLSFFPEPSAALNFKWNELSKSTISIGNNISFPTMRQLFSAENGNPNLKPQNAIKCEISHQQKIKAGNIIFSNQLSLFYNNTRNLIDRQGDTYQNIYKVHSAGTEYSLMFKPFAWWESELAYSYIWWEGTENYELTETPHHQANFTQNLSLPWKLKLRYTCSYNDNRFSQDKLNNYHILSSYWLHNIGLSYKFKKFSLAVGLENIFDTYYETEYGYPGPGLNFFTRLSIEF
ncbi:MAG TPA: TonB-dependent receptor [Candidatus Syntrophosphaera thermopropionivorans]|nr:TonB-dependent receptor [Candidatus Syntrophosphaera thermopropionivorans]